MIGVNVSQPSTYSAVPMAATGYVPGLGRGAVGFTTRSDIGPARPAAPDPRAAFGLGRGAGGGGPPLLGGAAPAGYVVGMGRGGISGGIMSKGPAPPGAPAGAPGERETKDYSETNYDEFSGYGEKLFSDVPYDADDREADAIYEAIDERMDSRRKRQREASEAELKKKLRVEKPSISDQFADLKRDLARIPQAAWEAIPEAADLKQRHKPKREESMAPVPDYILEMRARGAADGGVDTSLDVGAGGGGLVTPMSGFASAAGTASTLGLAQARGQVLKHRLDSEGDSLSGQTNVDPKGYLTDLNSLNISSDAEIGDAKKARLLLQSVTATNPRHAPGWIAAARVEEKSKKLADARRIIAEGCKHCPDNEDVWLEAVRLAAAAHARDVLAEAVRALPNSVKLWMRAAEMEDGAEGKRAVLRLALETIPNSVRLWKAAVELEEPEDAKVLLGEAVQCVPKSVDLWLALARLESYENARKVLNDARRKIPTEPQIWLAAARLEEARGNMGAADRIVNTAVASLKGNGARIDREEWQRFARECEAAGAVSTAAATVRASIGEGVEDVDRKRTWIGDAEQLERDGAVHCARAVYAHMTSIGAFRGKKGVWLRAAALEKKHGSRDALEALLRSAVAACPQAEVLWLMAAKERWLAGDVAASRAILQEAFRLNSESEQIWLAAVKLEWENGETVRARALLLRAREKAPSARVWMKSALLEREVGDLEAARALLVEGVGRYSHFPKLWMMLGQLHEERGDVPSAREAYHGGTRNCPDSVVLWRLAAALEERCGTVTKARSLLEVGRLKNPKNPMLYLEAIRLERRVPGNEKLADSLMARALQDCPTSGVLLAEDIRLSSRAEQKRKATDALRKCDSDPHVIMEVALLFARDRKFDKASKWLQRAVTLDPKLGDAWAAYYRFLSAHGTPEELAAAARACEDVEPNRGEVWCAVSKRTSNRRLRPSVLLPLVAVELPAA